ncbi:peptidase C1B, bleomycin hydrolase [Absidia repens]|uniref:Cysteine proteinase 1, mitochondrial n=1 Tax=Absidia repens TaxID=90262 RepID=A0A1X2J0L1_9FUNG|nr:peptidase C1B, bleomycin hydrolase [Absidia repens]
MGAEQSTPRAPPAMDEKTSSAYAQQRQHDKQLLASLERLNLNEQGNADLQRDILDKYEQEFWSDQKNVLAMNAIMANDPTDVLVNPANALKNNHVFNVQLDLEGTVTNQKQSGRCWLFAGTNVLRLAVIDKYKLKDDFELSQNYLFFYDKLEKANWFLENMIDLADKDVSDRVVQFLLQDPVGDGGQWAMFSSLVDKYGVVPKSVYPETVASSSSSKLGWLVTVKLREFAIQIRKAVAEGVSINSIRVLKQDMMKDIHRIMVIFLGEPPKSFDWEATDKNGKFVTVRNTTPKKFFKEVVGYKLEDTLSLINDPRNAYNKLYTVDRLGNVVGGHPVQYINVDISIMKHLAIKVLKSGKPVWFGCDVTKFLDRKYATMDTNIHNYELAFNVDFKMDKKDRILYGESAMTHAMVFTGVHLGDDGKALRWRVENSWGDSSGDKGYYIMQDDWFTEYVYQLVLEKNVVPQHLVDLLKTDPAVLPPYDPMGTLA